MKELLNLGYATYVIVSTNSSSEEIPGCRLPECYKVLMSERPYVLFVIELIWYIMKLVFRIFPLYIIGKMVVKQY